MLKFIDILTILLGWGLAFYIRFYLLLDTGSALINLNMYILLGLLFSLIWYFCMEISGVYDDRSASVFSSYSIEIWPIIKSSTLTFLLLVVGLHFLARDYVSRAMLVLFLCTVVTLLILQRMIVRSLFKKNQNPKNILIIGEQLTASKIKSELDHEHIKLAKVISTEAFLDMQYDNEFCPFVRELAISDVIICLDSDKAHFLNDILEETSKENLYTHIIPNIFHFTILGLKVGTMGSFPILSVNQHIIHGFNFGLKRSLDIVVCVVALILFSPVFILLGLLIKLTSKGSIFYAQDRIGMDGKSFRMYKFRSMTINAEEDTGPVWASKDDDRTTVLGKIIRRTSLDELPQLVNVLKGEMSIVGPRPERPVFVEKFKSEIPGYMQRHKIKSGITGWAQINGYRGNTDLKERIKYDLYYINNWSIMFDIKIMILTLTKGFISKDAY